MDNLIAHKYIQALGLLKDAHVQVRLLADYSPDFNPIELVWSNLNALLRKAQARTNDALL